jgi:hypothetical protein
VKRQIQYVDNCLPEWSGTLRLEADGLSGGSELPFDGKTQGVFAGDTRPIRQFPGFHWHTPGMHFLKLVDGVSGVEAWSNPCYVTADPPTRRIYWGDPHWQTFFSDGIRCPEELYAFARDEGFLDFGAISDHVEGITDRQWEYFQAVTNDYNQPGIFATLQGQEWTNHNPDVGAPGHRNVYYRSAGGPILRSNDPECDTLPKLWRKLDAMTDIEALAVPHHSANVVMGVDWEQGWNAKYEKLVEIYSVWGNSERPESAGNPIPIRSLKGEMPGRHVIDALNRGYQFGFIGGGDVHDGRPGDALHRYSYPPREFLIPDQGLAAVFCPALTREDVFDALRDRQCYATTRSRVYLEVSPSGTGARRRVQVRAASEDGIREATVVQNGDDSQQLAPEEDPRVVEAEFAVHDLAPDGYCYVRVLTEKGNMAWSSPFWGDD